MENTFLEKKVLSTDGVHELIGRIYLPQGQPVGVFQVVHGMTEHIARYDGFMRKMADAGYICFGYDHLGHGLTAKDDSELGFIAHRDGWKYLCDDVAKYSDEVRSEYGKDLPYYLLGHSMGSFIVRVACIRNAKPDKLIVMGTGGPNPVGGIGLFLAKTIRLFCGERHYSNMFDNIAFGSYNKRFADENDSRAWLSKDRDNRIRYAADKFCTFRFTISAMTDLMELNNRCNAKSWFKGLNAKMPVLLVSGEEDPVGNYGVGVKDVYGKLQEAGADVRMKLYPTYRHEILNEDCKDEVVQDILQFLA